MSMEHQQGPSKKPYTTPVLTVHGSVQKLTENSNGAATDGKNGSNIGGPG